MNSAFEPCHRCGDTYLLSELNNIYLCDDCEEAERQETEQRRIQTEEDEQ